MLEPVNEIRDLYISFAMERYTAAIYRYTEIYGYLQRNMKGLSNMEAFKARLREEEEAIEESVLGGNRKFGGAERRSPPVLRIPLAKMARGMPVDTGGALSSVLDTDNEGRGGMHRSFMMAWARWRSRVLPRCQARGFK